MLRSMPPERRRRTPRIARHEQAPDYIRPARDYFRHLTVDKFLRKVLAGEIDLPVVRMERSQKSAKGIHINDLAEYFDKQAAAARKECEQLRKAG